MTRWEAETLLYRYQKGEDAHEQRPFYPSERGKEASPYENSAKPHDTALSLSIYRSTRHTIPARSLPIQFAYLAFLFHTECYLYAGWWIMETEGATPCRKSLPYTSLPCRAVAGRLTGSLSSRLYRRLSHDPYDTAWHFDC
jgi:hypothetical protein